MATIAGFAIFFWLSLPRCNVLRRYRSQLLSGSFPSHRSILLVARYCLPPCGRGCLRSDRSAGFKPPPASARPDPFYRDVVRCSKIGAYWSATCPPRQLLSPLPVLLLCETIRHRETHPARHLLLLQIGVGLGSRLPRAAPWVGGKYPIRILVATMSTALFYQSAMPLRPGTVVSNDLRGRRIFSLANSVRILLHCKPYLWLPFLLWNNFVPLSIASG